MDAKRWGNSSQWNILRNRNFRLLWVGEAISHIGDQFYLIALPWLVLILTGDPLALGLVLALAAVPRAIFMFVGGALTDRFSPRMLMIVSNVLRLAIVSLLTMLVFSAAVEMWMLYLFALGFGLADSLFYPAQFSILPQIVEKWQLQAANSLVQGMTQFSLFAGPVIAGLVIAIFGGSSEDLSGIGIAFSIDALTFLASLTTLFLIRIKPVAVVEKAEDFLRSLREGLAFIMKDPGIRLMFIMLAAANFLVAGPFDVGIPVLADTRLPEGAAAFGLLMSALGGGSLLGILVAGALPEPRPGRLGSLFVIALFILGIGTFAFAFANTTLVAAIDTFCMGVAIGYVDILIITWVQRRTPMKLMGRTMGMMMFASAGLLPISFAISGAVISLSLPGLFIVAGLLLAVLSIIMVFLPSLKAIGAPPPSGRG
jgi:MFS family permease